jgi:translation initiation factor 2 alpha subunit (eIF-2alpha)
MAAVQRASAAQVYDRQLRSEDTEPWKNTQQQEQPKEPTLAELAERIEKLEEYVATQAVPTFDDIYKMFTAVLSKAQAFESETFKHASELHTEHNKYMQETRDKVGGTIPSAGNQVRPRD